MIQQDKVKNNREFDAISKEIEMQKELLSLYKNKL